MKPSSVIRRIGLSKGYAKFGGVSKPVLSADHKQSHMVKVHDLPASKVFFAAALSDKKPSSTQPAIFCTIYFSREGAPESPLLRFELSADDSGWHEATAELPAIRAGGLRFECRPQGSETTAVRWAQPVAVPLNTKPEPLIVLISLDTLRADHVAGFGGDSPLSPALAKIGEEGLRHLATTSEGTWTLTSHYSLLFSRIYGFPVNKKPLRSLAQTLGENGFVTVGLTGGGFVGAAFNFHLGFDHYTEQPTENKDFPCLLTDAEGVIKRFQNAPTFLFLHTYVVHEQTKEEKEWVKKHGFLAFPLTEEHLNYAREFYAELVRSMDAALSRFFESLRAISLKRPVLVVILSDHGEAFGEHDNFRHGESATLHDEQVRVPLIVWGPGLVPPARTSVRPTMLSDIMPSILAAAGIEAPHSTRGHNLWSLWAGETAVPPHTAGNVCNTQQTWSLRGTTHKLIVHLPPGRQKKLELYDLKRDPGETENLAKTMPQTVLKMYGKLLLRLQELNVPLAAGKDLPLCKLRGMRSAGKFWRQALSTPSQAEELDQKTIDRLRALGYVK